MEKPEPLNTNPPPTEIRRSAGLPHTGQGSSAEARLIFCTNFSKSCPSGQRYSYVGMTKVRRHAEVLQAAEVVFAQGDSEKMEDGRWTYRSSIFDLPSSVLHLRPSIFGPPSSIFHLRSSVRSIVPPCPLERVADLADRRAGANRIDDQRHEFTLGHAHL